MVRHESGNWCWNDLVAAVNAFWALHSLAQHRAFRTSRFGIRHRRFRLGVECQGRALAPELAATQEYSSPGYCSHQENRHINKKSQSSIIINNDDRCALGSIILDDSVPAPLIGIRAFYLLEFKLLGWWPNQGLSHNYYSKNLAYPQGYFSPTIVTSGIVFKALTKLLLIRTWDWVLINLLLLPVPTLR